ncbi:MAG: O-antigen ligase family protein [Muribaculaceae bacterium]
MMRRNMSIKCSSNFIKFGYLWGIKNGINFGLGTYPLSTLGYAVKFSLLPLICDYFTKKEPNKNRLFIIGLVLSQYFVLANIPFSFGILKMSDNAVVYDGVSSFVSLFVGQHALAIVTAMSMLFIAYRFKETTNAVEKFYNGLLLIYAAYVLYSAFTRTGWVMGIIGMFIIFTFKNYNIKKFFIQLSVVIAIFGVYNYMLENNPRFYHRVNDITQNGTYKAQAGSGRLIYKDVSLKLFEKSDLCTKLIGVGIDPLMDNMDKQIHIRIYSHNGWVDALVANGIIGFMLMVTMCIYLIIHVIKNRKQRYSEISIACVLMYISYQFTQGGVFFYQDLLIALAIALTLNDSSNEKSITK